MSSMFHFFLLNFHSLPPSEPLEQARCLKRSGSELIKGNSWRKSSKLRLTAKGKTREEKSKRKNCANFYISRGLRGDWLTPHPPLNSLVLVAWQAFFSLIKKKMFFFIVRSSCIVIAVVFIAFGFLFTVVVVDKVGDETWSARLFIQVSDLKDAQGHVIPSFLRYDWKIRFSTSAQC